MLDPYLDSITPAGDYSALRDRASAILQTEGELLEIVQLVGEDSLSPDQKLVLGLTWTLILRFEIQRYGADGGRSKTLGQGSGSQKSVCEKHVKCVFSQF